MVLTLSLFKRNLGGAVIQTKAAAHTKNWQAPPPSNPISHLCSALTHITMPHPSPVSHSPFEPQTAIVRGLLDLWSSRKQAFPAWSRITDSSLRITACNKHNKQILQQLENKSFLPPVSVLYRNDVCSSYSWDCEYPMVWPFTSSESYWVILSCGSIYNAIQVCSNWKAVVSHTV